MFSLVVFQQKATGSGALTVGLVPVGREEVMKVTTPNASRDLNVSYPLLQLFHKKARNVMPCHEPREERVLWKQGGPEVQYFGIFYLPFHFKPWESQNVDLIDQILLILPIWKKESLGFCFWRENAVLYMLIMFLQLTIPFSWAVTC